MGLSVTQVGNQPKDSQSQRNRRITFLVHANETPHYFENATDSSLHMTGQLHAKRSNLKASDNASKLRQRRGYFTNSYHRSRVHHREEHHLDNTELLLSSTSARKLFIKEISGSRIFSSVCIKSKPAAPHRMRTD